jgi:hypothetical protein
LPVRVEVKSGAAGGANAVGKWFDASKKQSDASKAVGDVRPFVAAFIPDGSQRVLWVVDSGHDELGLVRVIEALVNG